MTVFQVTPLSNFLKFKPTAASVAGAGIGKTGLTRARILLFSDCPEYRVATAALTELTLTYEIAPIELRFNAGVYDRSTQLYHLNVETDSWVCSVETCLKEDLSEFIFKDLGVAIGRFFLEAQSHVQRHDIFNNTHLWLHTLINDFEAIYEQNIELFCTYKLDICFLKELSALFYDSIYLIRNGSKLTKDRIRYITESLKVALVRFSLNFLEMAKLEAILQDSIGTDVLSKEDRQANLSKLSLIQKALPRLTRIIIGFHACWVCSCESINLVPKSPERAYSESYKADIVFFQSLQATRFLRDFLFTPLEATRLSEDLLSDIVAFLNSQKGSAEKTSLKTSLNELIDTVSKIPLPVNHASKQIFEQAIVKFFNSQQNPKVELLANLLAEGYFYLFYPKKIDPNLKKTYYDIHSNHLLYPMTPRKGPRFDALLKSIPDDYLLRIWGRIPAKAESEIASYLKTVVDNIIEIAQAITCPDNEAIYLAETTFPRLIVGNYLASRSLKKLSDICERVNEELDPRREHLSSKLAPLNTRNQTHAKKALDEICQSLLKQCTRLIINPNFISKVLYYIQEHGLCFKGDGTVIIDIDPENVDLIIPSLIHLGLCPTSFLELFEWELEPKDISKAKKPELAHLIIETATLEPSLELGAGSPAASLEETLTRESYRSSHSTKSDEEDEPYAFSEAPSSLGDLLVEEGFLPPKSHLLVPQRAPFLTRAQHGPAKPKIARVESSQATPAQLPPTVATSTKSTFSPDLDSTTTISESQKKSPLHKAKEAKSTSTLLPSKAGAGASAWSPHALAESTSEAPTTKTLPHLIEELNNLLIRGVKTSHILKWLEKNEFKYLHHTGSHAIYKYKTGHISIPDHPHLKIGLLSKLKNLIVDAFEGKEHLSPYKKAS